ncbi:hypothetical protein [Mucilaginibacter sp.]
MEQKRGKKWQKAVVFEQNLAKKCDLRAKFGQKMQFSGLKWGLKGSKMVLKTAFSALFRAFLGLKVYQMFHLYRGTVQHTKAPLCSRA